MYLGERLETTDHVRMHQPKQFHAQYALELLLSSQADYRDGSPYMLAPTCVTCFCACDVLIKLDQ